MKISLALAALGATMASAFDETTGKYGAIDTTRAPRFFDQPKARKAGYTYEDEVSISVSAEMDTNGMAMKGTFAATGDTLMTVSSAPRGNVQVVLGIENVKADLNSFIMSFHCDSNDQANSDPDCLELFEVVGQKETLIMDKDGTILEMTDPDGETFSLEAASTTPQQSSLASQFQANQLAASHHFDKSQQLLKLIPDHAVRPGDSWIDDVDMGNMGTFKGNSYLKGYTSYEGSDCALFTFEGTLHLDISQIAQSIGADVAELPTNMADATITNDIVWDLQDEIARWIQVNISTSFDIPNPMAADPETTDTVHIPVDVTFALATDILERPKEGDKPETVTESAYKTPQVSASASAPQESKKSSGGGVFKTFFFMIMVGAVAAAGFMYYKKRQDEQVFASRPAYEFSPVGVDNAPIYNSPPLV